MTSYQWLGLAIIATVVATPLAIGFHVNRQLTWSVVWRIAVTLAFASLLWLGAVLLIGVLP